MGENYSMYNLSPVTILENKWFKTYIKKTINSYDTIPIYRKGKYHSKYHPFYEFSTIRLRILH